jgi:hypothetical protein
VQGASLARFVTLAALIVSVALSLWLADADAVWIVVGVAAAWLVASIVEWVAWNSGDRDYGVYEREWRLRSGYDQLNVAGRPLEETQVYAPPPPRPPPAVAEPEPPPLAPVPDSEPAPEPEAAVAPTSKVRALRIGRLRVVLRGGGAAVPAEPELVPPPIEEAAPEPEPVVEPLMLVAAHGVEAPPEPDPVPEPEPEPVAAEETPVEPPPPPAPVLPRPVVVPPPPEVVRPAVIAPPPAPPQPTVTRLSDRRRDPRQWNLWELERLARDGSREQSEEWHYLFVNLRRFAEPDGALPVEFDSLVRESFGPLLDRLDAL